ncbi:hypothetical protein GCM10017044_06640 [Kordiimonas sediminis]|uniref:DUF3224 domain-containing protein n=1 Tax=Kordiimonas sediminis TaxID=1735581 RepID=A0A919E5J0_9PROT|nr:DUF3224 domain-containing protein [Kordiimonas sediminis]GHF15168.1 hypothetical protein GCM10017044_06640 [Kordiimonas sediminis]
MKTATGSFEITMTPQKGDAYDAGRFSFDKSFVGEFSGTGRGQMLSHRTTTEGSAGYVAIETLTGTLKGKEGSFTLQHYGMMHNGAQEQTISIIPNSGSGDLVGIEGTLAIKIENGRHYYTLTYQLPDAP